MSCNGVNIKLIVILFVCMNIFGCSSSEKKESVNKIEVSSEKVFIPVIGQLNKDLQATVAKSKTIKKIQEEGILVAFVNCRGDNLCERDEYGTARGLEIDVLRRISMLLGVKLNIGSDADAAIYGNGTEPPENVLQAAYPYFYTANDGWIYFSVNGDEAFADTISGIIQHLYETGTYQQMYKNNFLYEVVQ